jgi:cell division protease FtsH
MDGFESNDGVILIAANRPDVLDPALLRRALDRRVVVSRPDVRGRGGILRVPRADPARHDVDLSVLARASPASGRRPRQP